jgi:hypothetical protein
MMSGVSACFEPKMSRAEMVGWLLFVVTAGLLLAFAASVALSQQLKPGVGYSPTPGHDACFEGVGCFPLNVEAMPWVPTGDDRAFRESREGQRLHSIRYWGSDPGCVLPGDPQTDPQAPFCTSFPGGWPQGQAAENLDSANGSVLREAFDGRCPSVEVSRAGFDGQPTEMEIYDFAVTHGRYDRAYRQCWWERKSGGTPELAIVLDASDRVGLFQSVHACELGITSIADTRSGWLTYYDVQWLPESRPWCFWVAPPDGAPVDVQVSSRRVTGKVIRSTDRTVTIRPEGGRLVTHAAADENRLWWRVGVQPEPTPEPTPSPTPGPTPTSPECEALKQRAASRGCEFTADGFDCPSEVDEELGDDLIRCMLGLPPERCEPAEPELCPCEDNTVAARELLEKIAAWPRDSEGKLRARFSQPIWWLVANAEKALDELRARQFCPCFRTTGQVDYQICEENP